MSRAVNPSPVTLFSELHYAEPEAWKVDFAEHTCFHQRHNCFHQTSWDTKLPPDTNRTLPTLHDVLLLQMTVPISTERSWVCCRHLARGLTEPGAAGAALARRDAQRSRLCLALARLLQKLRGTRDRKPPQRSNRSECKHYNLKPHFDLKWPSTLQPQIACATSDTCYILCMAETACESAE